MSQKPDVILKGFHYYPQGLVDIRHYLQVSGHHLATELESCAEEIAVYLADHSNWQQPIFPDVPGCSRLLFVPPYFDILGSYWDCNNQGLEGKYKNVAKKNMIDSKRKWTVFLATH